MKRIETKTKYNEKAYISRYFRFTRKRIKCQKLQNCTKQFIPHLTMRIKMVIDVCSSVLLFLVKGSTLGDDSSNLLPLRIVHRNDLPIDNEQPPILSHPDRLDVLLEGLINTVLSINRLGFK